MLKSLSKVWEMDEWLVIINEFKSIHFNKKFYDTF